MTDSGPFWKRQGINCSQKQNPRFWSTKIKLVLPRILFVNCKIRSNSKTWILAVLWKDARIPGVNKACFTKNWQLENELYVTLKFEKFMTWKHWGEFKYYVSINSQKKENDRGSKKYWGTHWKIQDLQNEINCMSDSRDFKDAESVHSGPLSHVPNTPASFPLPTYSLDCWTALQIRSLMLGIRMENRDTFFANSNACSSALCSKTLNLCDDTAAERIPMQECTGTPVAGVSDRDRDRIPTPRIQRSSSAGNSFYPTEWWNFRNSRSDQQRLHISELHYDRFTTPQTFSCWKEDSRPKSVPAEISLRKQSYGSKK